MEPVEEGIWNLVGRCAEAVRESGADCFTLWADSVPRERRSLT